VLPGHGKTVMAAYIAGRQGSVGDAVVVGATVTGTHTGGVLLLGAALTMSTSLAGESVLGWLGVTSGLLVAALGVGLLRSAARHRGSGLFGHGHTHRYDPSTHGHTHSHGGHSHSHGGHSHTHGGHDDDGGHDHDPGHDHGHDGLQHVHGNPAELDRSSGPLPVLGASTNRQTLTRSAVLVGVGAGAAPTDEEPVLEPVAMLMAGTAPSPPLAVVERRLTAEPATPPKVSRHGLIGMGIAGGLVPSPSALIILLSAIALGRTWFGIVLVLAYGVGMAATLTAAGLLLITVRDRVSRRASARPSRLGALGRHWGRLAPYTMAALVLVVGVGLAVRSLGQV
jgi:ABC-type nickel/cobalt efflux system permease component RcnA